MDDDSFVGFEVVCFLDLWPVDGCGYAIGVLYAICRLWWTARYFCRLFTCNDDVLWWFDNWLWWLYWSWFYIFFFVYDFLLSDWKMDLLLSSWLSDWRYCLRPQKLIDLVLFFELNFILGSASFSLSFTCFFSLLVPKAELWLFLADLILPLIFFRL